VGLAQLFAKVGLAQGPRHLGQGAQMLGRMVCRSQQGEDQVMTLELAKPAATNTLAPGQKQPKEAYAKSCTYYLVVR